MPLKRRALSPSQLAALIVGAMATWLGCATGHPPVGPPGADPLPLLARTGPAQATFEGDFSAVIERSDPSRRFVSLLDLTDQLDLRSFDRSLRRSGLGKAERRSAVIGALERVAERQQARLRPVLDRLQLDGSVGFVRSVVIVNRIVVEATPAGLHALASSPEVATIRPDWGSQRERGRTLQNEQAIPVPLGETFRSWAIDALGAGRLWARGLDGTGVVVGAIDTGAYEPHEQLRGRLQGDDRGWFDPVEGTSSPSDQHGHGTGVLSLAVGANPAGRVVGVAPGARWCAALGNWRNFYSRSRMTMAADWMLRVGRPDVLVNAWSHDEGACSDFDRPFIDAWKASGIFVVFPAGNAGPAPASGEAPAQLAGIFPDGGPVFSVAGLSPSGLPLPSSSRGPSRCGSPFFPSVAGPGGDLPMAAPGSPRGYVRAEGTSLTAGLIGGAVALLLQAEPESDPSMIEKALLDSARDIDPSGRDDATGAGAVDLGAALENLRRGRSR